ncbi:MAG: PAS domain S-box protein [Burkholderiales bacterium]|nr:PAS domain S-box protein [Burkholderiales bacterium]
MRQLGPETLAELPAAALRRAAPAPVSGPLLGRMARACLWACAASCGVAAVMMATMVPHAEAAARLLALVFALLALASAAAVRLPERRLAVALTMLTAAIFVAIGATALAVGWGSAAPGLPLAGLVVCMVCAVAGWRAGALLALVAALTVAGVAWLGPLPAVMATRPSGAMLVATELLSIAGGLAAGVIISHVMGRYIASAQEREERFRSLLGLAADGYWEIDQDYRLRAATSPHAGATPLAANGGLGQVPWELDRFGCDADILDELQADLDHRLPFRDLPVRWAVAPGEIRDYVVSGEPRFDARGVFTGYWGVARDVSAVHAARDALAATETRYQELFTRIPTPLLLHRNGRIIDANAAALVLFDQNDLAALARHDLLSFYESGDSRERARRRMEQLAGQAAGTALPVTDFRLRIDARVVSVRATSVCVDAEGGPAMLAIYVDDTERLAAEDAVRRSEALLSHLVATSPDLITLTELASGRYAMVNHAFEAVTGWTAAEAVGRTSVELGIWGSDEGRVEFVERLRAAGLVQNLPVSFAAKDGSRFSLLVSAARFVMDRREYMVINARDVTRTERERMEREAILANASIGIAVTRDRRYVLANRHLERIVGWERGELVGQHPSVVWSDDDEYARTGRAIGPALARGEAVEFECQARRKDGGTFVSRVRGRAIDPAHPEQGGTVWIVEDVTERRQFEQALARARDEAEAANRAKSAFLANTSHELRTPLNGLIGMAQLAGEDGLDEAQRRQYLDRIVQDARALAGIISDILDLSKIEAGKFALESRAFHLADELRELQRSYAVLASARGLALRLEIEPAAEGRVLGDPLRLRQIASNYLTNAIKFTDEGTVVLRLRAGTAPGRLRLEVQDSGAGIDAATRQRLFKPFTQADDSTTRRYGGTGLGLSICHELATLMGGGVGVDSEPGAGCLFWAELPLPAAPPGAPPAPPPAMADDALVGRRVLMVEDNAVNMLIAVTMLERWGIEVTQAHDGSEAVAAVERSAGRPFDAVLMDVQMPVMGGYEATRALRRYASAGRLPVIALTAAALVTERDEAMRAGMNDFLTKPIDARKLRETLLRWCPPPAAVAAAEPAAQSPS